MQFGQVLRGIELLFEQNSSWQQKYRQEMHAITEWSVKVEKSAGFFGIKGFFSVASRYLKAFFCVELYITQSNVIGWTNYLGRDLVFPFGCTW